MKLNREDLRNINGWFTAASMMIEAKARVPWRESELATYNKLETMKKETTVLDGLTEIEGASL